MSYRVDPHWHVSLGKKLRTSTLIYADTREEIAEWIEREVFLGSLFFDSAVFKARRCLKPDCKPRPHACRSFEDYLKHPAHGWWRRIGLDDDLV